MHPDCRYDDRLEYWRSRTARKRGQLELARPSLMPLLGVLANDKERRELAEFASWAVETSRHMLAGSLSVRQMTQLQRHLKYAETIHALTTQAPPASELRLAKNLIDD